MKLRNGPAFGLETNWAEKISRSLTPGYSVVTRFLQDSLADELCFVTERVGSCSSDSGSMRSSRPCRSDGLVSMCAHPWKDKRGSHAVCAASNVSFFRLGNLGSCPKGHGSNAAPS